MKRKFKKYTLFVQGLVVKLGRRTYAGIVVVIVAVAALVAYIGLVLNAGQTSQPAVTSGVLSDLPTDVGNNPTFFDVVSAKVVRSGSDLSFSVTVSGEIPKTPTSFVALGWFITSGVTSINQPIIILMFDPAIGNWTASIFAGRPPSASTRGLSFTIEENVVTVSVPLQTLGNPQNFTWHVVSRSAPFAGGIPAIDRAPDSGNATWSAT